MRTIEAARRISIWHFALGAIVVAFSLTFAARAHAGETGSTDEYGGVSIINSVLLDPFDPVPEVRFHHGSGEDYDGREGRDDRPRCISECRWHGWYCPHDCYAVHRPGEGMANLGWWRCADDCRSGDWWCDHDCHLEGWHCERDCFIHEPCEHDCGNRPPFPRCEHNCRLEGDRCLAVCYGQLVHEYDERLRHYDEQAHWYFEHVMEHHDFDHHDFDHRDGDHHDYDHRDGHEPPPPPPPVGMTGGPASHPPGVLTPMSGPAPTTSGPSGYSGPSSGPSGPPPSSGYGPPPAGPSSPPPSTGYGPPPSGPSSPSSSGYGPPPSGAGQGYGPGPGPSPYDPPPH